MSNTCTAIPDVVNGPEIKTLFRSGSNQRDGCFLQKAARQKGIVDAGVKPNLPNYEGKPGELHTNELEDKLLTYLYFIVFTELLRETIEALACIFYVKDARYKPPLFESLNCISHRSI